MSLRSAVSFCSKNLPDLLPDQFFQGADVGCESTDAFGQFFRGHGIFVEQVTESLFVQIESVDRGFLGRIGIQFLFDRFIRALKFGQKIGGREPAV